MHVSCPAYSLARATRVGERPPGSPLPTASAPTAAVAPGPAPSTSSPSPGGSGCPWSTTAPTGPGGAERCSTRRSTASRRAPPRAPSPLRAGPRTRRCGRPLKGVLCAGYEPEMAPPCHLPVSCAGSPCPRSSCLRGRACAFTAAARGVGAERAARQPPPRRPLPRRALWPAAERASGRSLRRRWCWQRQWRRRRRRRRRRWRCCC